MNKNKINKMIAVFTLTTFLAQPGYALTVSGGVSATEERLAAAPFAIELSAEMGQVEVLHTGAGPSACADSGGSRRSGDSKAH